MKEVVLAQRFDKSVGFLQAERTKEEGVQRKLRGSGTFRGVWRVVTSCRAERLVQGRPGMSV